jgi:ATP-binding cassette, subfamily B, bacterial
MLTPRAEGWRPLVRAFRGDVAPHWKLLATAYAARAVAVTAAVAAPWPLKLLIDHVLAGPVTRPIGGVPMTASPAVLAAALTGGFLLIAIVGVMMNALEKNISALVRERITFELRDRLIAHVLTLAPTLRSRHRSGELVLRLIDDTDLFVRVITKTAPQIFQHALTLVGTLAMMFWVEPRMALAGCLWLPLVLVVLRRDARRLWRASREKRTREGDVCGLAQEVIRGMAVIQASGDEAATRARFRVVNQRRVSAGRHETAVAVTLERTLQIVQAIAMAMTTMGGAWLVLRRQLSIGGLALLTAYVSQLFKPVEKLNDLAETTGRGVAGGERLLKLLELGPAVTDRPGATPLDRSRGVLEMRDVWFEYPERARPVLRRVTLRLRPGELAVLTGASGAGKSTLFGLLVRLYDPSAGEVRLDGRPLPAISLRALRAQFAVLSQDTHLFAGTLREALTGSAPPDEIWKALALVSLDEFVAALPLGLATPLGEDGLNLSGGQRRRVALARAFLLRRPILLLDEPLANIDADSAAVILNALDRLRLTQTCFAVTHDRALIERADRVYRIDSGHVYEVTDWPRAAGTGGGR